MYLVFIAMMAMQMSKEVLQAFSLMNDKFVSANQLTADSNDKLLKGLALKADEKPEEFSVPFTMSQRISKISDDFYAYIESQKNMILDDGKFREAYNEEGQLPAEKMEKGDFLDEFWFAGDKISKEGQAFVDKIQQYKEDIKKYLVKKHQTIKLSKTSILGLILIK